MISRFSLSLALALLLLPVAGQAQSLLLDNFNAAPGTLLTGAGWVQNGTVATNPIAVTANNLMFPNFPATSGNAAALTTSGQDVNRSLVSAPASGAVYAAFLVNVSAAQTAGDYFFALLPANGSTNFGGRVYARLSAGAVQFGLTKTNNTPLYTTATYPLGTTVLLVVKYTFVAGTANDPVSLFVLNAGDALATEPATPTLTDPTTTNDLTAAGAALLRQGTAANAPTLTFDGLRVGTSWEDAVLATQTVDDGAGYRLLGAPVQNVTVGTLAGINLVQGVTGQYPDAADNLFLDYTGTGTQTGYVAATSTADSVTPGRGFFWYLYDQDLTPPPTAAGGGTSRSYVVPQRPLFASGPVNTGDITAGFNTNPDGFYLLANPFAQALASTGITFTGSGTFSTTIQAYDPASGFVPINRTTATNLSMWQGFFAEVQQTAPPFAGGFPVTFTYLAASRTDALTALISRPAAESALALVLDGTTAVGTVHDEAAIVRLDAAASAGWDAGDASKLTPPTAAYALVAPVGTLNGQARRQAVLSLPAPADVTLAFTTTHAGTFTLTAEAAGLPADATVRDLATGTVTRLADGVTFMSEATDWTERFVVSFGRSTAGEAGPAAFSLGSVFPNPATAAARVALRVDAAQTVTATVVDALGRTVQTAFEGALAAGQSQEIAVDTATLAPGVYVVRVTGETFTATRRLVVAR
ncbi:MAG TPA: T9SS type A sorting domain-containing protein [Rubricoccaceae bacterium]|jgi:hypothetical protein